MVSEEDFADGAVNRLFSELSGDARRLFEISFTVCCPSMSEFQKSAAKKAKEYEGKQISEFYIDCLPDHDGTFSDASIGFKDITLQIFGVAPIYQGKRLDMRRLETILDRGIFLKRVKPEERVLLLYNEDAGEFVLRYEEMAITRPLE